MSLFILTGTYIDYGFSFDLTRPFSFILTNIIIIIIMIMIITIIIIIIIYYYPLYSTKAYLERYRPTTKWEAAKKKKLVLNQLIGTCVDGNEATPLIVDFTTTCSFRRDSF